MAFESNSSQRFPYDYDLVFSALLTILSENSFKIISQNQNIGRIDRQAGMSLMSFGENISITLEDLDGRSTRVEIQSGLKIQGTRNATITGEAKNAKNIRLIISALADCLRARRVSTTPRIVATPIPRIVSPPVAHKIPSPPTKRFFIYINEEIKDPFTPEQINALYSTGTVNQDTQCCVEGSEIWEMLGSRFKKGD